MILIFEQKNCETLIKANTYCSCKNEDYLKEFIFLHDQKFFCCMFYKIAFFKFISFTEFFLKSFFFVIEMYFLYSLVSLFFYLSNCFLVKPNKNKYLRLIMIDMLIEFLWVIYWEREVICKLFFSFYFDCWNHYSHLCSVSINLIFTRAKKQCCKNYML